MPDLARVVRGTSYGLLIIAGITVIGMVGITVLIVSDAFGQWGAIVSIILGVAFIAAFEQSVTALLRQPGERSMDVQAQKSRSR